MDLRGGQVKKTLVVAAFVLALPLVFVTSSGSAWAVDGIAKTASILCSQVTGKINFDPPITNTTMTNETMTISEVVSGCDASNGISVSKGTVTVTFTTDPQSEGYETGCDFLNDASIFGSASEGSIVWTSSPRVARSTFEVAPMHFGSDSNQALIGWSFADIGGSFQGNYRGQYDQAWADGTISSNKEGTKCDKSSGLRSMNLIASESNPAAWLGGPNPD
jgi:hypothetical protein